MNEKFKKILVYIVIFIIIVFCLWTGNGIYNISRRIQQIEGNLIGIGTAISITNTTLEQLKIDNNRIAEIVGRWEEGNRKLDEIYRAIEAGNRRQEEIYRGITKSIGELQGKFNTIQASIGKLGQDYTIITNSIAGNQQLVQEAIGILEQLSNRNK